MDRHLCEILRLVEKGIPEFKERIGGFGNAAAKIWLLDGVNRPDDMALSDETIQ